MIKSNILIAGFLLLSAFAFGQRADVEGMMYLDENRKPIYRENIIIPDVNGYKVLKCDFHMHTVFSDGHVWPSIRNQEVWEEGLDAFALTEHIEYQPNKADVNPDHNRAYELLKNVAPKNNLILVKGSEITRNTPPGHFNAIFIKDSSPFIEDKTTNERDREAVMLAAKQNAFIFWNHPGWQPKIKGSYEWIPFVDDLYKSKMLHGIEVINGFGFHLKALDWCIDKGLTVMGTSDIHNLIDHDYDRSKEYVHRTMTLVMAKERTAESIREALDAGRTVAWASKILAGKEENVRDLFNACVQLMPSHFSEENKSGKVVNFYELKNNSDLYFELVLTKGNATKQVKLYPRSTQLISTTGKQTSIAYDVTSTYIRSDKHLSVNFELK